MLLMPTNVLECIPYVQYRTCGQNSAIWYLLASGMLLPEFSTALSLPHPSLGGCVGGLTGPR